MRRITSALTGGALGLFGLLASAAAQQPGYTLPEANLRAGPGRDYPLISLIPPNQPTTIFGCLDGYGWCDVGVAGMRGWIAGRKLQLLYQDRRVGLSYYAPRLALPLIEFDVGTYWGEYYRGRPFYADRDRWERTHPPRPGYHPPPPRPEPQPYGRPRDDYPGNRPGDRPELRGPNDHGPDQRGPDQRHDDRPDQARPPPTRQEPTRQPPDHNRPTGAPAAADRPAPGPQGRPPAQGQDRGHDQGHEQGPPHSPGPGPGHDRPGAPGPNDHRKPDGAPPPQ